MEQQKTRRLSLLLKRPLSERLQAVAEEEKQRKEVEEAYITSGAGQVGRLSNGGISTIPNNQQRIRVPMRYFDDRG